MNENLKKGGLIALIAAAVVAVGVMAVNSTRGDQMDVVRTIEGPPGHKSEKEQALEAQAQAQAAGMPVPERGGADLGDVGAGTVGTGGKN